MNVRTRSNIRDLSCSTTSIGKLLLGRPAETARTALERRAIANIAAAEQRPGHGCRARASLMRSRLGSAEPQSP